MIIIILLLYYCIRQATERKKSITTIITIISYNILYINSNINNIIIIISQIKTKRK